MEPLRETLPPKPKGGKQTGVRVARLLLAVGLISFLLTRVPLDEIGAALRHTDLFLFGCAVLIIFPTFAIQAVRWKLLYPEHGEPPLPTRLFFKLIFVGQFAGLFLPSTVGGDAVRAYLLGKKRGGIGAAGSSVVVGRVIGVLALFAFVWIGAAIAPEHLAPFPELRRGMAVLTVGAVAAAFLFFRFPVRPGSRLASLPGVSGIAAHLRSVRNLPRSTVIAVIALSIAIQLMSNLHTFLLYRAAGMPFPWEGIFSLIPLLMLLNIIPISFFNIGVREGAMLLLFAPLPGVTPPLCMAAAALGYLAIVVPSALGFLFYLRRERQ